MDYRVVWSPDALEDIESIADYISRDSEVYARAVVRKILAVSRELPAFPFTGRIVPEVGDEDLRERVIYSYRLIYRLQQSTITIIAVIHGNRSLEPLWDRFDQ